GAVTQPDGAPLTEDQEMDGERPADEPDREMGGEPPSDEPDREPEGGWAEMPDLLIIDGGQGQLNAALEILDTMEITELPAVGLAKENEEVFVRDRATGRSAQDPLLLPRSSQAMYLVQRLRDEAHRFAITSHRNLRGRTV